MSEVASGLQAAHLGYDEPANLMLRFALSLHDVSSTVNVALDGLLLVTHQIYQFCNIFFGRAMRMQRTIGEFQPSCPVI